VILGWKAMDGRWIRPWWGRSTLSEVQKEKGVKNLHLDRIRTKRALKVRTSNQNCEVGVVDGGIWMDESAT